METPHANRLKGLIPKGSHRRSSLSTAQRFALYFITEFEYTEKLSIKGRDVDYGTLSKVEVVKAPATDNLVNLARPPEPTVSYFQIANFVVWSVMVIVIQMWRDYREGRPFRSVLANDFATHYFYIPISHRPPRVITSGCDNRIMTRLIPESVSRNFEEDYDLSLVEPTDLINCASNNYGGFSRLEFGAEKPIKEALEKLPFAPAPATLEQKVRQECAEYMNFDTCVTAPSGFSTNVLAFGTMGGIAHNQGRKLVFLCDRDCHNSMFTGAFFTGATVHKFNHNDLTDLEYKLRMYREQEPSTLICVAVEGIYSLEGAVSLGPAIVALKKTYKFALLVDEAHSFMALGSAGRGSFNYWEDLGYECPLKEVDLMSCMFSKSVGCTGGFVLANGIFAAELHSQEKQLKARGVETLSTVVLLRVLGLLRKPLLIQHRMRILRKKAEYVARELKRAGFTVLASPGSAVVCFPVGSVDMVSLFHKEACEMGLGLAGAGPPATPTWGCRIRLCIFGTTTWPDIYKMLNIIVKISLKYGVGGARPTTFDKTIISWTDDMDHRAKAECDSVDKNLSHYVDELSTSEHPLQVNGQVAKAVDDLVRAAGVEALHRYGIGPCSARWFYGGFDVFTELERRLARMYPSLVAQSRHCRAMICGDAEITIGSTLTALAKPCASKTIVNRVFCPSNAPHSVILGAKLARPSKHLTVEFYDGLPDLLTKIENWKGNKFHLTIFFETVVNGSILDLVGFLQDSIPGLKKGRKVNGLTMMLDDRNGLGKIGPKSLGYLNLMEEKLGPNFLRDTLQPLSCPVYMLVAGSWFDAFGHQGGYVTGTASTIECLTWEAKAFFFSTPPMPLQAAMSDRMLAILQGESSK